MFALEVNAVSKSYRLYAHPVDRLKELLLRRPLHRRFDSLHQVSFQLGHGGILGVIGDNGAGKSTLLKLLAGTLSPSSGEIIRRGRVAALLELGAGFHPEFSGRQNIHLNATLLGLSETEIQAREPEIIAFSELGEFIDRPVKTYSSGMYVRLAFSIATSVDPDILIIDEALSVGDAHFQKKCVDRMTQFKRSGKTILFCSHSMYMVQELCDQAIWLHQGRVRQQGRAGSVINAYTDWIRERELPAAPDPVADPRHNQALYIRKLRLSDAQGHPVSEVSTGDDLYLELEVGVNAAQAPLACVGFSIDRNDKLGIYGATTLRDGLPPRRFEDGARVRLCLPGLSLLAGRYYFNAMLADETGLHLYHLQRSHDFNVHNERDGLGVAVLPHHWELPP